MSTDRLTTVKELCERWSLSRPTIEALIRQGDLDVVRLGSRIVRITEESVDRLLAAGDTTVHRSAR